MLHDLVIWLVVSYSCAVLIAFMVDRLVYRNPFQRGLSPRLVRILLYQSAEQLEEAVRSVVFASRWQGTPIRIQLADHGSTDDTRKIISILIRNHLLVTVEESTDEPAYVLDLRAPHETMRAK